MAKPPNPVKLRRLAVGLTSTEVAERTSGQINTKLLSRLENGHAQVLSLRKIKFVALAEVLGLSEAELQALVSAHAREATPATPPIEAPAPPLPDVHQKRLAELERSVDIGISKMRDELRRLDEHLTVLEAEVARLRLH